MAVTVEQATASVHLFSKKSYCHNEIDGNFMTNKALDVESLKSNLQ